MAEEGIIETVRDFGRLLQERINTEEVMEMEVQSEIVPTMRA
jgi:hypothetical protein